MQTPGFSPLAKKTPAPEENFQLQQIRKNSKFSEISHFKVEASTIFVFDFNTSHEHFVVCMMPRYWLRKTTEYYIYMFVGSLRSINASIYFFVDVRQWFAAQISAAGVEQAPAPAK